MSGSTQYTVASNAAYDGTKCPHPDVSVGSGVDIAATANVGATPNASPRAEAATSRLTKPEMNLLIS